MSNQASTALDATKSAVSSTYSYAKQGVAVGLQWVQKLFETVSTGIADAYAGANNLLGTRTIQGFEGPVTISPSRSPNLKQDLWDIWSQTYESRPVSSEAWHGALPNLGKVYGTTTDYVDVIDVGIQTLTPVGSVDALSFASKAVKRVVQRAVVEDASQLLSSTKNVKGGPGINSPIDEFDDSWIYAEAASSQVSQGTQQGYRLKLDLQTFAGGKGAGNVGNKANEFIDLTAHRKDHILNRHRAGAGKPEKTEFPATWSDDRTLHEISDVATDPKATWGVGKWDSPYAIGTRDGIDIRVDFYPSNHPQYAGKISTAYPINVPANPPTIP